MGSKGMNAGGVPPHRRVPFKGKDHKETVGFLKRV
jgi:hypothetical protein